jgi:aryl-alcohol dehydrogenase-like predicted oxidoreductase
MSTSISLRKLGHSNLDISPLGLGTWQFSKQKGMAGKFWTNLPDEDIIQIVRESLEGGINWIDTAEMYGNGESEKAVSRALTALGRKPGEVIIATKWWPLFRLAKNIETTIHTRIEALAPYGIDLYQVHQPYGLSSIADEMNCMGRILKQGLIKNVGVSNFSAKQMERAYFELGRYGIRLASNQVHYNLLNRKIERNGILEKAKELGVTIIAYSPLAQGILTGKFHDNPALVQGTGVRRHLSGFKAKGLEKSLPVINQLKQLASKYQVTPGQVALNWLIHYHGDTVVAIPGATRIEHAKGNTQAMQFRLEDAEMRELDKVSDRFI